MQNLSLWEQPEIFHCLFETKSKRHSTKWKHKVSSQKYISPPHGVVVKKKSGGVRICVDLKPLNKCVLHERHPLPRVDDTLAQLTGATIFSKLDTNSGFWQIPLSEESKLLTTFITPFGRYYYNKLPFDITSAPEHFQRRMSSLLERLQGVLCVMDDIIVFGKNQEEHDSRLHTVLTRLSLSGITLNSEKCEFSKNRLTFLGHIIDSQGISADPSKTAAITQMDPPKSVTELHRFLGMINQLGKFTPNIAELSHPLRKLLSAKKHGYGDQHKQMPSLS